MKTFLAIVGGIVTLGVLAAVALKLLVPDGTEMLRHSHEASAQQSIHYLDVATIQYNSMYGRYPSTLSDLGSLISADLATGEKDGYRFTLKTSSEGYSFTAVPLVYGSTGQRTFYVDQTSVLRYNQGPEPATAESPAIPAP